MAVQMEPFMLVNGVTRPGPGVSYIRFLESGIYRGFLQSSGELPPDAVLWQLYSADNIHAMDKLPQSGARDRPDHT